MNLVRVKKWSMLFKLIATMQWRVFKPTILSMYSITLYTFVILWCDQNRKRDKNKFQMKEKTFIDFNFNELKKNDSEEFCFSLFYSYTYLSLSTVSTYEQYHTHHNTIVTV